MNRRHSRTDQSSRFDCLLPLPAAAACCRLFTNVAFPFIVGSQYQESCLTYTCVCFHLPLRNKMAAAIVMADSESTMAQKTPEGPASSVIAIR